MVGIKNEFTNGVAQIWPSTNSENVIDAFGFRPQNAAIFFHGIITFLDIVKN